MASRTKFLLGLLVMTVVLKLTPYILTAYNEKIDPSVLLYPWNFMPLTAACLFSGAYVKDRRLSIAMPLLALFVSDLGIWALTGEFSWGFPSDRWSAYVSHAFAILIGSGLGSRHWPLRGLDAFARGMLAEVLFFGVTNYAYFQVQTEWPQTSAGLMACFAAAIPFAWKSFASTAFYSVLLFSPLALRAAGDISVPQIADGAQLSR